MTARRDRIRVTTFVAVTPADAFDVFTREIDQWWRRSLAFRRTNGALRFEAGVGGRLVESAPDAPDQVIGRVLVWEPGARLVFTWAARNFRAEESTEVDISFTPRPGGTEVVLEHRGWAAIPDDHPVRHGEPDAAFNAGIARWWGDLVSAYRARASGLGPRTSGSEL